MLACLNPITAYKEIWHFFRTRLKLKFLVCCLIFLLLSLAIPHIMLMYQGDRRAEAAIFALDPLTSQANNSMASILGYTWGGLWFHNVVAALLGIVGGIIPYAFIGVIALIANAIVLGYSVGVTELMTHYDLNTLWVVSVFPHGILEYAIHIFVYALSITMCQAAMRWMRYKDNKFDAVYLHRVSVEVFLWIVVPGLFICSLLEFYITPFLIWKVLMH